jgi:hypothetical protein
MNIRPYVAAFFALVLTTVAAQGFPLYYSIADHGQAQAEARQRNLPLAWLGGQPEDFDIADPVAGSNAQLQQMALKALQDHAVIIFFDGKNMTPVPSLIHSQFHIHDDGELKGGASWITPKVVFTNPEATQILGRTSYTEMRNDQDAALNSALQIIRNNPALMAPPAATVNPPAASGSTAPTGSAAPANAALPADILGVANRYGAYLVIMAIGAVLVLLVFLFQKRGDSE